jgi:hypothetical protein
MRTRCALTFLAVSAFLGASLGYAQDSQSLGDVARQSRQQKQQKDSQAKDSSAQNPAQSKDQQSKDGQSKDASATDAAAKDAPAPKTSHVITNDEIPEHVGRTVTSSRDSQTYEPDTPATASNREARAEQWQSQIQNQKSAIVNLRQEIANLNDSVHYAGGNCVANCVQWNERQKEKQDRVETMKAQLEEQQKRLEDMQESARKQGFGSSVYDP